MVAVTLVSPARTASLYELAIGACLTKFLRLRFGVTG